MSIIQLKKNHLSNALTFCVVVKFHSVEMAAEMLGIHRNSVTRAIRELEASVGKKMVEYNRKGFNLTPFGKDFYFRHREIANTMMSLIEEPLAITKNTFRSQISILLPIGGAELFMSEFQIQREELYQLTLSTYSVGEIASGQIGFDHKLMQSDIAIVPKKYSSPVYDDNFRVHKRVIERFHLIGRKDYIDEHHIDASNYQDHIYCIGLSLLSEQLVANIFDRYPQHLRMIVDTSIAALKYVMKGRGLTYFGISEDIYRLIEQKEISIIADAPVIDFEYLLVSRKGVKDRGGLSGKVIDMLSKLVDQFNMQYDEMKSSST